MDPLNPQELFAQLQEPVNTLASVVGLPLGPADPLASTAPLLSIPGQLQIIMGQNLPNPDGQWVMSNNALYYAMAGLRAQFTALADLLAATRADLLPRLQLAESAGLATAATDQAQTAQLAALAQQQQATTLALTALQAYQVSSKADIALLKAQATTDETAIAKAQATADSAKADATQAINAAALAQSRADAAQATATAASQAAATNAAALTAVQADVAKRLPTDAVRRGSVTAAAVSVVVGTPARTQVVFAQPMAGPDYEVFLTKPAGSLLGVELGWENKTVNGFTITRTNTGLATLAVPQSAIDYFAIR
jgi:hypothetical protein